MNKDKVKISRVMLERYVLGEVTPEEKAAIDAAIARDREMKAAVDNLRNSNATILAEYPTESMARDIGMRAHLRDTEQRLTGAGSLPVSGMRPIFAAARWYGALALVAVCSSLAVLHFNRHPLAGDTERVKGLHPYLTVYRKAGNGFERLRDSSVAVPGDRIQVGYVAAGERFGMIFSRDGSGVLTVHYPAGEGAGDSATKIETAGEHLLPESFELDNAPQYERFYFLASDRPIPVSVVISQFGRGRDVAIAGTSRELSACRLTTFTLLKGGLK
jgi:hypothetical protein